MDTTLLPKFMPKFSPSVKMAEVPKIVVSKFTSKRNFGIELEFGNKISGNTISAAIKKVDKDREVYVSQEYSRDTNNSYYHVKLDHSCGDIQGDYGWELASFKASGIKDIALMGSVTKSIREAGANINDRCALHTHVETSDFSQAQLAVMAAIWIKIEPFVCHMIPAKRAEFAEKKYAKFLRHEKWVGEAAYNGELTPEYVWSKVKPTKNDHPNRRKSMNMCNHVFTDRKTVEFRFPESTLSDYDVRNWLKFFILFVENSKISELPKNLDVYDFPGFLQCCGLYGRNPFLVLSSGMRETKIWLLNRIINYSRSGTVCARATEHLDMISQSNELSEGECGT